MKGKYLETSQDIEHLINYFDECINSEAIDKLLKISSIKRLEVSPYHVTKKHTKKCEEKSNKTIRNTANSNW